MLSKAKFRDPDPSTGVPKEDEYRRVSIIFSAPDKSGASPRGVRLFPGDDTPRVFRNCKLINCEPPPGSTLIECTTPVIDYEVADSSDTLTVNGAVLHTSNYVKNIVYGVYQDDGTYLELPIPEESDPKRQTP